MNICSFLPSATETLYALGLGDSVAGVTFECDFPPEARHKPVVVRTKLRQGLNAGEVDRAVTRFLQRGESLYTVDAQALERLRPDLVITQDLCHVCATSPQDLATVLAGLAHPPEVLCLSPMSLGEVWDGIRRVGKATGASTEAEKLMAGIEGRMRRAAEAVAGAPRVRTLCLEWLDPPFIAGHWVPEMVDCAGGTDVLGLREKPGFRSDWAAVLASDPEVVVVMPCGYDLRQTVDEFRTMPLPKGWETLCAVRQGRVFAVDPSAYFSRPGPRLATGVEILARILHPERFAGATLPPGCFQQL